MSRVGQYALYAGLRSAYSLLDLFPVNANLRTAGLVGSAYIRCHQRHRARGLAHLAEAYPEWSTQERERVNRESFQHLIKLFMVEAMQTPGLLEPSTWHRFVDVDHSSPQLQRTVRLLLEGRPAIFVTGHCGSWELLGFVLSLMGFPMTALARSLDNPYLNEWIVGVREARGLRVLDKFGASEEAVSILRRGGRLGFIADQNAGPDGVFVPFFRRFASVYKSIALLAMTQNAPIVVGGAFRTGSNFHYRLCVEDVIEPHEWEGLDDPLYTVTARYTNGIERMVRRWPSQYLWLHRRWKSRPRHERDGTPVPARLEKRVRSLPWFTAAEADRFIAHSNALAAAGGRGQSA